MSHTGKTGLLMMTYERESKNEFGIRSEETHNATVCMEELNFEIADYICGLLNINHHFSQQWGRSGDTEQNREQE